MYYTAMKKINAMGVCVNAYACQWSGFIEQGKASIRHASILIIKKKWVCLNDLKV
jgi:hypothetical protein